MIATQADILEMLAKTAYSAYRFTLISGPQFTKDNFNRMNNPVPGDLVLETSTHYGRAKAGVRLGYLLRKVREPFPWSEEEIADNGGECPTELCYYIRPLDGSVPEYRWTNASFIAVPLWERP